MKGGRLPLGSWDNSRKIPASMSAPLGRIVSAGHSPDASFGRPKDNYFRP